MLKFLKDIIFYSGGSVIGRLVTLFLLPFTTSYLTPENYGVIGILTLLPVFANGLFSLGFHTSLGRIYSHAESAQQKQGIIWTAFIVLLANNIVLTLLAVLLAPLLSYLLFGQQQLAHLIGITFVGIGICTVRMPFEYYLRATQQAKKVFCLNLVDVTVAISTMLFMLIYLQRSVRGYMEAIVISHTVNLVVMLLLVAPKLLFSYQVKAAKELIKMGLPCIYGYWGYCLLQGSSRYMLQLFSTEQEVGLYFLGSNMGRIIELPLWGFMSAWVPLFNSFLHKQQEAPAFFSKMMFYYLLGMSLFLAPLFCLAKPLVQLFVQPAFHEMWKVIGLTAVAQSLWGVYAITYPALIFHKKTRLQSMLELSAGLFCMLASSCLVPLLGMQGAAFGMLVGFMVLIAMSYRVNQRLLPTTYDFTRMSKIAGALIVVASLSFLLVPISFYYNFAMVSLVLLFYLYCAFYVVTTEEKKQLKQMILVKFKKSHSLPSAGAADELAL